MRLKALHKTMKNIGVKRWKDCNVMHLLNNQSGIWSLKSLWTDVCFYLTRLLDLWVAE